MQHVLDTPQVGTTATIAKKTKFQADKDEPMKNQSMITLGDNPWYEEKPRGPRLED